MKTKLTFLTIAIAALLGVGMLMAFKQEDTSHYVIVSVSHQNGYLMVSDESTQTEVELKFAGLVSGKKVATNNTIIAKTFNDIKSKGYKLKSMAGGDIQIQYIFEKE